MCFLGSFHSIFRLHDFNGCGRWPIKCSISGIVFVGVKGIRLQLIWERVVCGDLFEEERVWSLDRREMRVDGVRCEHRTDGTSGRHVSGGPTAIYFA